MKLTNGEIARQFHILYGRDFHQAQRHAFWLGVRIVKCPFDPWVYQEIIYGRRPDVIIECGTHLGGSALFLASICDLIGNGRVITIDVEVRENLPGHERIHYLHGSSTDERVASEARSLIKDGDEVMAILDSDHRYDHVLREMHIYGRLVTKGQYMIVEDTNINGYPLLPTWGSGPMEAVQEFLAESDSFVADESREKFHLTFNPNGYLEKVR